MHSRFKFVDRAGTFGRRKDFPNACLAIGAGVAITLTVTAPARSDEPFIDRTTGFSISVPDGFGVGNRRTDPNHDVLVDITSPSGQPPVAGNGTAVCAAGFKRYSPDFDQTQAYLNSQTSMEYMAQENRRRLDTLGMTVQSVNAVPGMENAASLEFTATPNVAGPDRNNVRIYIAFTTRPVGRSDLVCATTRDGLRSSIDLFRRMLAGITVPAS